MKRIEELGAAKPWTALKTASASHSTTTSQMPMSRVKRKPTSIDLAFVSRAPRDPPWGCLEQQSPSHCYHRSSRPALPSFGPWTQPYQSLSCTDSVEEAPNKPVRGSLQLASTVPHWPTRTRPLSPGRFSKWPYEAYPSHRYGWHSSLSKFPSTRRQNVQPGREAHPQL